MNTAERIADALMDGDHLTEVQLPVRCTAADAARLIDETAADIREMTAAITVPITPVRRVIRNTGREFEEAWRCDADPDAAERAARSYAKGLDYMRSPSVRRISETEWAVRYWGLD